MEARREASDALGHARLYGSTIEEGVKEGDPVLASLLAAEAVCLELRALGMIIDHAVGSHAAHVGPR
jgi:hypothetical protein